MTSHLLLEHKHKSDRDGEGVASLERWDASSPFPPPSHRNSLSSRFVSTVQVSASGRFSYKVSLARTCPLLPSLKSSTTEVLEIGCELRKGALLIVLVGEDEKGEVFGLAVVE